MSALPKPSIDVCAGCGKLYPRVNIKICPHCAVSENKRFDLVRDHLVDNAGAGIREIAEATGLSRGDVAKFLSQGRLVEVDASGAPNTASSCTCDSSGTRCTFCRLKLARTFQEHATGGPAQSPLLGDLIDPPAPRVQYVRRLRRTNEE